MEKIRELVRNAQGQVIAVKTPVGTFEAGEDENGIYAVTPCARCGRGFRNYSLVKRARGRPRELCEACRAPRGPKVEDLGDGRVRLGRVLARKVSRVAVFLDGPNLYKGLRDHGISTQIDYDILVERICEKLPKELGVVKVVKKVFANGVIRQPGGEIKGRRRSDALRYRGWLVREFPLEEEEGGRLKEKGLDGWLGLEMYRGASEAEYDLALLISGDGDFVPSVEGVRRLGKKVVVAQFQDSLSRHLAMGADGVVLLDALDFGDLFYGPRAA